MRRLRLPILALLAAVLIAGAAVPVAALDAEAPPSPGWSDALLAWLPGWWSPLDALTGASTAPAPGDEPTTADDPVDPTVQTSPPGGSQETDSGHAIDPDG